MGNGEDDTYGLFGSVIVIFTVYRSCCILVIQAVGQTSQTAIRAYKLTISCTIH